MSTETRWSVCKNSNNNNNNNNNAGDSEDGGGGGGAGRGRDTVTAPTPGPPDIRARQAGSSSSKHYSGKDSAAIFGQLGSVSFGQICPNMHHLRDIRAEKTPHIRANHPLIRAGRFGQNHPLIRAKLPPYSGKA